MEQQILYDKEFLAKLRDLWARLVLARILKHPDGVAEVTALLDAEGIGVKKHLFGDVTLFPKKYPDQTIWLGI